MTPEKLADTHLSAARIAEYVEHRTSVDDKEAVERHLAGCDACRTEVISIRRMVALTPSSEHRIGLLVGGAIAVAATLLIFLLKPLFVSHVGLSGIQRSQPIVRLVVLRDAGSTARSSRGSSRAVSYVSLIPGSVPRGKSITITNRRSGHTISHTLSDGGVDPLQIPAVAGDTLRFVAVDSAGRQRISVAEVRQGGAPTIVRTNPETTHGSLPLNGPIQVIFSEPIAPTTATQQNIFVRRGAAPVKGAVSPSADGISMEFRPLVPLVVGQRYTLVVTTGITDLAGESLKEPAEVHFTTRAPLPIPRIATGVGVLDGIIYVFGGWSSPIPIIGGIAVDTQAYLGVSRTNEAYNPATNTWVEKAPMIATQYGARVAVVGGILYAIGGSNAGFCMAGPSATVQAYDPVTDSWSFRAPTPIARCSSALAVENGLIYVVGGDIDGAALEVYNPATNTWVTKAPAPTARGWPGAEIVDGTLYVIGGADVGRSFATVDAYDIKSNTWSSKAPMSTPRSEMATGVLNGIIYVAGGLTPTGRHTYGASSAVEAYNPVTNTWTTLAPLPTPRIKAAGAVVNGVFYTLGGQSGTPAYSTISAKNEAFSPGRPMVEAIAGANSKPGFKPGSGPARPSLTATTRAGSDQKKLRGR